MTRGMATVTEAAAALGWSAYTVRKGCADGWIPHIRAGSRGSIRIAVDWLQLVLNGDYSSPPSPPKPPRPPNPVRIEAQRQRRHGLRGVGPLTIVFQEVGERRGWRCAWADYGECYAPSAVIDHRLNGRHKYGPTLEHLIPVSKGGTNDPANLSVLHWTCNVRHGDRGLPS